MSGQHTPGPWSVPHFAKPEVNCRCEYVLTENLLGAVCTVHASGEGDDWQAHGDNPKFQEAVANAYLIAAAPKLLAFANEVATCRDEPGVPNLDWFVNEAKKLVAAATGQSA